MMYFVQRFHIVCVFPNIVVLEPFFSSSDVNWIKEDEFVKITGIFFKSNVEASKIELNWKPHIESITRTIFGWNKRNISLYGKIILCKTYLISKLNFILQSLALPKCVLEEIDRLIFKFLWQKQSTNKKAYEKIKRSILCKDIPDGGLNMISVQDQQKVFLIKWLKKVAYNEIDQNLPSHHLLKIGGAPYILNCKVDNPESFLDSKISSHFWKEVVVTWLQLNNKTNIFSEDSTVENILKQPIFLNTDIKYKGNILFIDQLINSNIKYICHLYQDNKLMTLENLKNKIQGYPSLFFDYNAVTNAFPKSWKEKLKNVDDKLIKSIRSEIEVIPTLIRDFFRLQNKDIRKIIVNTKNTTICSENFWKKKFNINTSKLYSIAKQTTSESRLRLLHFKILHNIYPTNILLSKMKVKENNLCETCHVTDYLEHFFVHCIKVRQFWKSLMNIARRDLKKQYILRLKLSFLALTKWTSVCSRLQRLNF